MLAMKKVVKRGKSYVHVVSAVLQTISIGTQFPKLIVKKPNH